MYGHRGQNRASQSSGDRRSPARWLAAGRADHRRRESLSSPARRVVTSPEVVVVEYFDFNCPFCRKLAPSFQALLKSDPKVAVVYKDWPIFGGVSVYAARCALAAQWQGQYGKAHEALIAAPRLSQNGQVDEALQRAGIDMSQI